MVPPGDSTHLDPRELADLSALADGSLDPARRPQVEARIAASPELTALLAREQRAVAAVREAGASVAAPPALRARIAAERPSRGAAARRRAGYGAALAGALAALALALILVLPGGTPGAPSVSQAAGLAALGPVSGPPGPSSAVPYELATRVGALGFPDWSTTFGWHAAGQRTDHINGRVATTVYYDWHGHRIAYTIVASPALHAPAAPRITIDSTELRTFTLGGRLVVTWRRDDHTCVLSGDGVTAAELQRLAAWQSPAGAAHAGRGVWAISQA